MGNRHILEVPSLVSGRNMGRKRGMKETRTKGGELDDPAFWLLANEFLGSVDLQRAVFLFLLREHEPITEPELTRIVEDVWKRFTITAAFGLLADQGKLDAFDGKFKLSSKERREVEQDQANLDSELSEEMPEARKR